jgi:hypothetical protein
VTISAMPSREQKPGSAFPGNDAVKLSELRLEICLLDGEVASRQYRLGKARAELERLEAFQLSSLRKQL